MGRAVINRWRRDASHVDEQRRQQAHEPPFTTTTLRAHDCRVCGEPIAVGALALGKSHFDGYSHVGCSFYTAAERARRAGAA